MKYSGFFLFLFLSGCGSIEVQDPPSLGLDGVPCSGPVPIMVQGLTGTSNDPLIGAALAVSDKGGVCNARTFKAAEPVRVYRVYDSSRPYSALGKWWSLSRPSVSREQYRVAYAICPEWSALDRLISCELKPGAELVLGTTQSVQCEGTRYPKSADIQVYIANDSRAQTVYVDNCIEEPVWPELNRPPSVPLVVNSQQSADNPAQSE